MTAISKHVEQPDRFRSKVRIDPGSLWYSAVVKIDAKRPRQSWSRHFAVTPTVVVGALLALWLWSFERAVAVTIGGPFTLSAPDGSTVTDRSFSGRWLLVYFGYTACPDTCPTALADMAKTLTKLGADSQRVQPIFITLDPRRDTRDIIGNYVKSFDARFIGLTGTQDQIDAVARAYGAYALPHDPEATHPDALLDHSVYIYLMNPRGTFVRAFDPTWTPERMAQVLQKAITDDRNSKSATGP